MNKIRVFIADDHRLFRTGLIELLKDQGEIEVVGEASDGEQTLKQIAQWPPDIVLMDIDFGPTKEDEGIRTTERIVNKYGDQVRVIMLTMHDEPEFLVKAFEVGARGYVLKESEPSKMLTIIREVYEGGVILAPKQAKKIMDQFRRLKQDRLQTKLAELTQREKDILKLVSQGSSNQEIASGLGLSEKTIRNRLSLI